MSDAFLEAALRLATPIWIAALGELVVQRAGVINIGIEGMMLAGAFAGFAVGVGTGSVVLGVAAALALAALLGLLFAWASVARGGDQIVIGTAINLLALGGTSLAFARFAQGGLPQAPSAPKLSALLPGWEFLGDASPFLLAALVLSAAVAFALPRTRPGLALRAVGERAAAAQAEGIPVRAVRIAAIVFGAMLAGLAGAALTLSQTNTFTEGMTAGRGFIALSAVIFGRWTPLGVVLASLFFAAASALQFRFQASGLDLAYPLWLMLPYVLTLLALGLSARSAAAPADLGRTYEPP